jgi:hypothetical protein
MKASTAPLSANVLQNEKGQSAVEYLVICTALVTMLLISSSDNSIYNIVSHTMQDKYKSYAFGVSISDPPSKKFDDEVKQDTDKVKEVLSILKEIGELISHIILPDILHGKMPSMDSIKEFASLVKSLF